MHWIDDQLAETSKLIWGPWVLIPLLMLTGLYLTFLLRGIQFRRLAHAFWLALVRREEPDGEGDISHYQALTVALAATVGVGTAIALGGPGALFWMWMTGLVGMATKYSEAFLGVKFRRVDARGEQSGGPMFYLSEGVKSQFGRATGRFGTVLAIGFAVSGAVAAFGIGNMVQSNSVAQALHGEWDVPAAVTGIVLLLVTSIVILGGIKSIGRVASTFVPFMVIFYILGATVVLILHADQLPGALGTIVGTAFTGTATTGGFVGVGFLAALRWGVARGIFSNESGLGTGGIAAASAKTTHEVKQALVSMTQTFLDTLVVITFTGLVIVVTGAWKAVDDAGEAVTGAVMTAVAFREGLPGDQGGVIVSVGIVLFAYSTLLGWAYYGERCVDRLFGRPAVTPYRVLFCLVVYVGAVTELTTVWAFADVMNGLMALPNLIGLVMLSALVARGTRAFFQGPDWRPERALKP